MKTKEELLTAVLKLLLDQYQFHLFNREDIANLYADYQSWILCHHSPFPLSRYITKSGNVEYID